MTKRLRSFHERSREYYADVCSIARPALTIILIAYVLNFSLEIFSAADTLVYTVSLSTAHLSLGVAIAWALIALTDALDGWLARKFKTELNGIGATLDERADKIAINIALLSLAFAGQISLYFAVIMLLRDIAATIIRTKTNKLPKSPVKAAQMPGKVKSFLQYVLIFVALLAPFPNKPTVIFLLAASATIMSLISGMQILLLALHAHDSSWLAGTNGKIGAPNWSSTTRMAIASVVPYVLYARPFGVYSGYAGVALLILALSTDKLDGWLARRYKQVTKAGKLLDPLCDKIILYPPAIALIMGYDISSCVPIIGSVFWNSVLLVAMLVAVFITFIRDFGFVVWYAFWGRKSPLELQSNIFDQIRFVLICIWLSAFALALVAHTEAISIFFAWLAFPFIIAASIFSIITIKVAIKNYVKKPS